ncbi:MAG: hypothetical protein CBC35_07645 [Planctomycetes bacterium TMED75]|nr:hypothetical protein [Planctomycetaceae bacterium]OUU92229.1 MAG: hypothetical protein CBC35_07645 [Planctomycetes bacterium TMED75]
MIAFVFQGLSILIIGSTTVAILCSTVPLLEESRQIPHLPAGGNEEATPQTGVCFGRYVTQEAFQ